MSYVKKTTIAIFLLIFINIFLFHTVLGIENITKEILQHDDIIASQDTTFSGSTQNSSVENENIIIEAQRSFDKSLDILNIVVALIGVLVGVLTLTFVVMTATGIYGFDTIKKNMKIIDGEVERIKNARIMAEKYANILKKETKDILKKEAEDLLHLPKDEKPSKELMEKSNELVSRLEISEMFGTKLKPDDYYLRGVNLFLKGKYEEAIKDFDKAIDLKDDYSDAFSYKGVAHGKLYNYEEAIEAYEKAIELRPHRAGLWFNKGEALGKLGNDEEAIKAYDKAIELKSDYASAWFNKGVALGKLDRYEEAIKAYDKAIKLKPDYADALSHKGVALGKLGNYEDSN